jgi:hypothetical protein
MTSTHFVRNAIRNAPQPDAMSPETVLVGA